MDSIKVAVSLKNILKTALNRNCGGFKQLIKQSFQIQEMHVFSHVKII